MWQRCEDCEYYAIASDVCWAQAEEVSDKAAQVALDLQEDLGQCNMF